MIDDQRPRGKAAIKIFHYGATIRNPQNVLQGYLNYLFGGISNCLEQKFANCASPEEWTGINQFGSVGG